MEVDDPVDRLGAVVVRPARREAAEMGVLPLAQRANPGMSEWKRSLAAHGRTPVFVLLDEFTTEPGTSRADAERVEAGIIRAYAALGAPLLNLEHLRMPSRVLVVAGAGAR